MLKQIFALLLFVLVWSCSQEETKKPIESIADLQERFSELNVLNNQLERQRNDLFVLIREFNSTRSEAKQFDIATIDTLMGAPEKEFIKAMFKEEKDISYNGLLRNILEKNEQIRELNEKISTLNEKIAQLENMLPKPHIVQKGDTHYEIVRNFLMNQYVMDKKQAREIAWKTAMTDNLLPGNKVWLSYDQENSIVGCFVTQGDAKIAPMTYEQIAKKRMIANAIEQANLGISASTKSSQTSAVQKTGETL